MVSTKIGLIFDAIRQGIFYHFYIIDDKNDKIEEDVNENLSDPSNCR